MPASFFSIVPLCFIGAYPPGNRNTFHRVQRNTGLFCHRLRALRNCPFANLENAVSFPPLLKYSRPRSRRSSRGMPFLRRPLERESSLSLLTLSSQLEYLLSAAKPTLWNVESSLKLM